MKAACVVLLLLGGATAAVADDDKATAAREYRSATQHYELGEYASALEGFKNAYRAYADPSFLFNIGQCHRQLGEKDKAIGFYRMYLIKSIDAPNKQQVKEMIDKLEAAIQQERAAKASPPQGTIAPGEKPKPEPTPLPVVQAQTTKPAPEPRAPTPIYKKWWLWTIVGVVVVGAAVGAGVGGAAAARGSTPSAATDFGTVKPF